MDPSRKRIVRLTVALSAALLLAVALAYTSFSSSSQATTPKQLVAAAEIGKDYDVTGRVEQGSYTHDGNVHESRVQERTGGASIPVRYEGSVPDPFREGREVIVTVRKQQDGTFEGTKVVTKCPSKFEKSEKT